MIAPRQRCWVMLSQSLMGDRRSANAAYPSRLYAACQHVQAKLRGLFAGNRALQVPAKDRLARLLSVYVSLLVFAISQEEAAWTRTVDSSVPSDICTHHCLPSPLFAA
eukprot:5832304-Pleurochrysis_carterae.AAC.2